MLSSEVAQITFTSYTSHIGKVDGEIAHKKRETRSKYVLVIQGRNEDSLSKVDTDSDSRHF